MPAPLPVDDPARLAALRRLGVLGTPPEAGFDDLTRLAALVCDTPIAIVSLIDADRLWFKSTFGVDATGIPRGDTLCEHAVASGDLFEVPDTTADPRFADAGIVAGPPHAHFYAGVPLLTPDGHAVGTLCVLDRVPRTLTADQRDALRALARQVGAQFRLRRKAAALVRAEEALRAREERFRAIFDSTYQYIGLLSPDGAVLEANRTALVSAGITLDAVQGKPFWECVWWAHNPGLQELLRHAIAQAAGGEFVRFEATHPLADGTVATIDFSLTPIRDDSGRVVLLVPEGRDVSDRKRAEDRLRESEERFRGFMDHSPALAFMKDADGRFVYVSEPCCERFGIPLDGWLGKTDADLWEPHVAAALREVDRRVLAGDDTVKVLEVVPTPDGQSQFWQGYKFPLTDAAGRRFLAGMAVDVTAEKRAEAALRESEERFRAVVEQAADAVFLHDPTGVVVDANRRACDTLGYARGELVGMSFRQFDPFLSTADHARLTADLGDDPHAGRSTHFQSTHRRKDGSEFPVEVRMGLVEVNGRPHRLSIARDITERLAYEQQLLGYQVELEAANARLHALATTDRLTGVNNRGAFNDKLGEEFDRAVRYEHPLSVVLLDVDHFKPFNDTFGHPAGDDVLQRVAALLRDAVRGTDTVARYGGEEFVVLLPDTDYAGAMVLAERVRRAVAGGRWEKRPVTVSVGVSTLTPDTPDAAALVLEADQALYRSKQAGRNRVNHGSAPIPQLATVRTPVGG